jgi:serine protease Do
LDFRRNWWVHFASSTLTQGNSTSNQANTTSVSNVQYSNETSTTKAVEKVQDAVVSVINYQTQSSDSLSSIFGNIESSDELAVAGEGSGVIKKMVIQHILLQTTT